MISRPLSNTDVYPFVMSPDDARRSFVTGIRDVYFVVQGAYGFVQPSSSSSSSSGSSSSSLARLHHRVVLHSCAAGTAATAYVFRAQQGARVWQYTFRVPHTGGIGLVRSAEDRNAALVFDTSAILKTGSGTELSIPVEPSRAQWHTEQVTALVFENTWRLAGVEDTATRVEVARYTGSPGEHVEVALNDGYNVELDYEAGELAILPGLGFGRGRAPDYGDTGSSSSSAVSSSSSRSSTEVLPDGIYIINGFAPDDGNLQIDVSRRLGLDLDATAGRITITKRY